MTQMHKCQGVATKIYYDEIAQTLEVWYHKTMVVQVRDGKIYLQNGGWWTSTTKNRINQAIAEFGLTIDRVCQQERLWYCGNAAWTTEVVDGLASGRVYGYFEGVQNRKMVRGTK
jgi:hypothetical protein